MFRDVLGCSGMFRNVPCSWFYRRPVFVPVQKLSGISMNIASESLLRLSTGSNKQTLTNRTLKPSWTEWNILKTAVDKNNSVILLLLDLTAAFDTLYHVILLSRLSTRFGVKGSVWTWLKFFLNIAHTVRQCEEFQVIPTSVGTRRRASWGLVRQSSKPRRSCTEHICL